MKNARSENRSFPGQAHTLGFLLRELYDALQARIYAAVAADGHPDIREVHSPVLRHLSREGARVADLARRSGLAKQSMAYIVEDLAASGYVTISPDPTDARAKRVKFTPRGRSLTESLLAHSTAAEHEMEARIGNTKVATMRKVLEQAVDAMSDETTNKDKRR